MKKSMKSKKGLCLIEMVLVIAIICILASVMVWNFMSILRTLDITLF
ncbi:MAG: prepilin-type N-terminal cleavage/methylation domain-containing protein [Clostridiales bacterium]|nr:prepilin-type N-terminal cleavage/methylation domain-containing protein [Clostridiales bacterium]MBR5895988.1 prepilin-type N-terminal cleavage/methylation domain-containing protein [Lachnospiraceae bacterium]